MENPRYENVWKILRCYDFETNCEVNDDLICRICKKIMINACNSPCGCRYCYDCLRNYLNNSEKRCPGELNDCENVLININRNVFIDQAINARIAQLRMKCPENCSDCLIELKEMENHIRVCNRQKRFCPFTNIGCAEHDLIDTNMKQHLLSEIQHHSTLLVQQNGNMQNEINILKQQLNVNFRQEIDTLKQQMNEIKLEDNKSYFQIFISLFTEKKTIFQFLVIFIFCFALINFMINNKFIGMEFLQENNQPEIFNFNSQFEQIIERLNILEVDHAQTHKEMQNSQSRLFNENSSETEFIWIIDNFQEKQKEAKSGNVYEIFSEPFYSHENGYKLQLQMDPDGEEQVKGKYISVYFCIMKGDNDDNLLWPFKYNITLALINQRTNSIHISYTASYDKLPNHPNWERPKSYRNTGFGFHNFLSLHDLKSEIGLIQDDKIVIKCIVHIPIESSENQQQTNSNIFKWVIINFSEKRKNAESGNVLEIFSEPFYSHKNGYKLSMQIYPNGVGESLGEYLSVYFCIMKGPFDDDLMWPFKGNVTMELINQHTDLRYVFGIISDEILSGHPNRNKPTNKQNLGLGFPKFVKFERLVKNPGLIHNDQIVIQVKTQMPIEINSKTK